MPASSSQLQDHIEIIAKHEEEFLQRRTRSERVGDLFGAFVGSLRFIAVHIVIFSFWIAVNTLHIGRLSHFDPVPFPLLDTIVALEAIFLASFIVMRQGRLSRRSDEREHLMMQILILAEKEITAVLNLERRLAARAGFSEQTGNQEIAELAKATSIDEIARTIRESIANE